jgi:uncharacterized membrane protein (UPF0127 family)
MLPRRLERLPRFTIAGGAVIHEARTPAARLLGLAFLRALPERHALLIPDCRSIHTFGMRFAIDVAFLDGRGRPIRVERTVPCRRLLACRAAFAVLESRAGEVDRFLGEHGTRAA